MIQDLTNAQNGFNFSTFITNGGTSVWIRAAYGLFPDASYNGFKAEAIENGLTISSYVIITSQDISKQAQLALQIIRPTPTDTLMVKYQDSFIAQDDIKTYLQYILTKVPGVKLVIAGNLFLIQRTFSDPWFTANITFLNN